METGEEVSTGKANNPTGDWTTKLWLDGRVPVYQQSEPVRCFGSISTRSLNGVAKPLLAAKVSLSGLHRHVSKQELNLVEFAPGLMADSGASSPEIVFGRVSRCRLFSHTASQRARRPSRSTASPSGACSRHAPKDSPIRDPSRVQPIVFEIFHPFRHRNGPNMRGFVSVSVRIYSHIPARLNLNC
jgi:hypothetical protein